jgi:hypothetical protein
MPAAYTHPDRRGGRFGGAALAVGVIEEAIVIVSHRAIVEADLGFKQVGEASIFREIIQLITT